MYQSLQSLLVSSPNCNAGNSAAFTNAWVVGAGECNDNVTFNNSQHLKNQLIPLAWDCVIMFGSCLFYVSCLYLMKKAAKLMKKGFKIMSLIFSTIKNQGKSCCCHHGLSCYLLDLLTHHSFSVADGNQIA